MPDDAPDSLSQRSTPVEEVTQAVLASAKYAALDSALVKEIAAQELAKGARVKDAVKQVKNRLHQSVAAYWDGRTDFAAWRTALAAASDTPSQRTTLLAMMRAHHSTRERLPFLDAFYSTLFAGLGPIRRVLDLGCGLNPLALPWMSLPMDAAYHACDVDRVQVDFLAWWLAHSGRAGRAFVWNLLDGAPPGNDAPSSGNAPSEDESAPFDVALLLKIVPCLTQLDKAIGARLLDEVTARVLIVSFPAQSLGGRRKGMVATYAAQMEALLAGRPWPVERFEFPSELVFRIRRDLG